MTRKSPNFPSLPVTLEESGPASAGVSLAISLILGLVSCLWFFQWAETTWTQVLAILLLVASVLHGRRAIRTPLVTTRLTDRGVRVEQKHWLSKPRVLREEPLSAFTGAQLSVWRDEICGEVTINVCLVHPDPDRELALYEAPFPVSDADFSTRLHEAKRFLQEACQHLKIPQLKDSDQLQWSRYSEAALAASQRGNFETAVSQCKLALEEAEALGEHGSLLSLTLYRLAKTYHRWGDFHANDLYARVAHYDEAEPVYQRALAIDEEILGLEHPDLVQKLKDLADLYYARCSYIEAEPIYQRALAIMEKALGPEHPDLTPILNGLADVYLRRHKHKEAEPLYKRALEFQEKTALPDYSAMVGLLNNYAVVLRHLKLIDEAVRLEERLRKLNAKRGK